MTSVFYPDCSARSANGKFILEARSPHNGTINHRNGAPATDADFAFQYLEHQSEFRYQLIENVVLPATGIQTTFVVWERWQPKGESSPHELVVSDIGWAILRLHGFESELVVISPQGLEVVRVEIRGPEDDYPKEACSATELAQSNVQTWRTKHIQYTSAGNFWSENSWRYFFRRELSYYFAWRVPNGQRLVIDLKRAVLLSPMELSESTLSSAMRDAEIAGAMALLLELVPIKKELQDLLNRRDEEGLKGRLELLRNAIGAIHLAGVHRITNCIETLRELEDLEYPKYRTLSIALGYGWGVERQYFRPIIQHSLRLLGQEPRGYAANYFVDNGVRFPAPELVHDRRILSRGLDVQMDALQVLRLLGPPDYVKKTSHAAGEFYVWDEIWDYDFLVAAQWRTLRVTWEQDGRQGKMVSFKETAAAWLSDDEREGDLLMD